MDAETPKSGTNMGKFFLPGAIVVAAVLISGTLLYTSGRLNRNLFGQVSDGGSELTVENLKRWAKGIRLDAKAFNQCLDSGKYKDEVAKDMEDGTKAGVTGTPSFFVNGKLILGAQPFAVFKEVLDTELAGQKGTEKRIMVSADDDPSLGQDNAPVTVIEFSDYQCTFCRRFFSETLPQIKKEYIDAGKVRFVYRDFPLLSVHRGAEPAAQAAQCANEQGKFWEMHDKIFQGQG